MASKGKGVARQPSSRTCGTSSRRQTSQEAERFETPTHAERGQILSERKMMHERIINFCGKQDTVREQIFARGWQFMYDLLVPINVPIVPEFYANRDQKNQQEVYIRGIKIPCHLREIEGVLHIPRLEGKSEHRALGEKYDSNDLDLDELAVCNILPTRHETTLGVDHIMLIYALMKGMTISLPGVMVLAMNDDPTKSKRQLLPFPMFITKWAEGTGGREADEDAIPPPMPAPAPPPATHTDVPASSTRSSPQPTGKELMRALRRNECVMRRHE
ncbi:hypothetical protein PIB30_045072 [Stylosanthes scabra]|uniref:Putative plant transposon protein domain-containing protein n=1 Tax=Stylosanthes scabra TaxID=79078 RepID=A0ABU6WH06_9FABA|nr:hypothetical protein [Stylosanthes scabra]